MHDIRETERMNAKYHIASNKLSHIIDVTNYVKYTIHGSRLAQESTMNMYWLCWLWEEGPSPILLDKAWVGQTDACCRLVCMDWKLSSASTVPSGLRGRSWALMSLYPGKTERHHSLKWSPQPKQCELFNGHQSSFLFDYRFWLANHRFPGPWELFRHCGKNHLLHWCMPAEKCTMSVHMTTKKLGAKSIVPR